MNAHTPIATDRRLHLVPTAGDRASQRASTCHLDQCFEMYVAEFEAAEGILSIADAIPFRMEIEAYDCDWSHRTQHDVSATILPFAFGGVIVDREWLRKAIGTDQLVAIEDRAVEEYRLDRELF